MVPLVVRRRSGLRLSQRPPRRARTGTADSVRANLPSGWATVTEVGVVSAEAVTGSPLDRACLIAWSADRNRRDASAVFACRGAAAWPGTEAAARVPAIRTGAARRGMARREASRRQRRSVGTPGTPLSGGKHGRKPSPGVPDGSRLKGRKNTHRIGDKIVPIRPEVACVTFRVPVSAVAGLASRGAHGKLANPGMDADTVAGGAHSRRITGRAGQRPGAGRVRACPAGAAGLPCRTSRLPTGLASWACGRRGSRMPRSPGTVPRLPPGRSQRRRVSH